MIMMTRIPRVSAVSLQMSLTKTETIYNKTTFICADGFLFILAEPLKCLSKERASHL